MHRGKGDAAEGRVRERSLFGLTDKRQPTVLKCVLTPPAAIATQQAERRAALPPCTCTDGWCSGSAGGLSQTATAQGDDQPEAGQAARLHFCEPVCGHQVSGPGRLRPCLPVHGHDRQPALRCQGKAALSCAEPGQLPAAGPRPCCLCWHCTRSCAVARRGGGPDTPGPKHAGAQLPQPQACRPDREGGGVLIV